MIEEVEELYEGGVVLVVVGVEFEVVFFGLGYGLNEVVEVVVFGV